MWRGKNTLRLCMPYLHSVLVSQRNSTITTLPQDQDAAISLPPSLFDLVNTTEVGIGFTFYETAALFPLPEGSPSNLTVGSSVVGALVAGQSFSDLQDPVTIFLHLTRQVCSYADCDICCHLFNKRNLLLYTIDAEPESTMCKLELHCCR